MKAITWALIDSLKQHIAYWWLGDIYFPGTASLIQTARCPSSLVDLLTYTDTSGASRIFGPCLISSGRLQENLMDLSGSTLIPSSYIEICSNDYERIENWRDSIEPDVDGSLSIGSPYLMEIGGGHRMHRRLVVKMTTFFSASDQNAEDVQRLGSAACSFLESMVTSRGELSYPWAWDMLGDDGRMIIDAFGEHPYVSLPVFVHSRRRGGPPDDFIWDIKIYLQVSTYKG